MKCPICGKDVELMNRQVGTAENGDPVFNQYAVCRSCRKQWNLDKQRAKKKAAQQAAAIHNDSQNQKAEAPVKQEPKPAPKTEAPAKQEPKPAPKAKVPVKQEPTPAPKAEAPAKQEPKPASKAKAPAKQEPKSAPKADASAKQDEASSSGKKPVKRRTDTEKQTRPDGKRYGNIPPAQVRVKHERAVRKGYEDMLAADSGKKSSRKKHTKDEKIVEKTLPAKSKPDSYDEYDDYDESNGRFRPARIILGILSLIGFGFFAYNAFITGLNEVAAGTDNATGTTYIILALCMLVAALLYFILQKRNTVFAFLLPMLFYLGSAALAFLKRGDDIFMLICATVSAVLALISLILAITSRGVSEYDDEYDDEDDDDEYDDDDDDEYDDDDDEYDD